MPRPFEKGNKLAKGGARPGSGPKTKKKREIRKMAEELAKDFIQRNIQPVLDTYGKVAQGYMVKKTLTTKSGNTIEFEEFVYDSQILKHYMDRVIPARAPEDSKGNAQLPGYYQILPPE